VLAACVPVQLPTTPTALAYMSGHPLA